MRLYFRGQSSGQLRMAITDYTRDQMLAYLAYLSDPKAIQRDLRGKVSARRPFLTVV